MSVMSRSHVRLMLNAKTLTALTNVRAILVTMEMAKFAKVGYLLCPNITKLRSQTSNLVRSFWDGIGTSSRLKGTNEM